MNALAEILARPEPTMAVTFTQPISDEGFADIIAAADVAELRVDKFPSFEPDYLIDQAKRLAALPLLLTIRYEAEGGGWSGSEEERLDLFTELLPYVHGVDIELASSIFPEVTDAAHIQGQVVIASSHDFEATPPIEVLESKLIEALESDADYVKFASSAKTIEDFQRLAEFSIKHRDDNLIVVGMNDYGPLSRVALSALGSHLTYAFAGETAIAPGQLGYRETRELLQRFYPAIRL